MALFKVCVFDFACCVCGSHPALLYERRVMFRPLLRAALTLHISLSSTAAEG